MKPFTKFLLLLAFVTTIFFSYTQSVNAACSGLTVDSSNAPQTYTVTSTCTPGAWSGHNVYYFNTAGDAVLLGSLTPQANLSFPIPSGVAVGTTMRLVLLDFAGDPVGETSIQVPTDANPGGQLKCGDLAGSANGNCPPGCPPTDKVDGATVPFFCSCGGLNQPLCDPSTGRASCSGTEFTPSGGKCVSIHSPTTSIVVQGKCSTADFIDTAIGCVPIGDLNTFASFFLKWGLGISGGVATLFLIYASFMVITSQGDPKRLQVGKELLMSAISGIILLALSVFIFRILGVNILGIF